VYGCIAGFGVTVISNLLIGQQFWLRVGGEFFFSCSCKTFLSKPAEAASGKTGKGLAGTYASTLFLTLTNPITILAFAGIFRAGAGNTGANYYAGMILVLGCSWVPPFVDVPECRCRLFRTWFNGPRLRWVNRFSA